MWFPGSLNQLIYIINTKVSRMQKLTIASIFILFMACSRPVYENPHVIIKTGFGDIEVELFTGKAPNTTAAFLHYIDSGYYENSTFYRVLKAEELPTDHNSGIIQGGIWKTAPERSAGIRGITHESTLQTSLSHTDGILSMARLDTGTAKTEFFICIGDQSPLDYGRRGTPDGQGYAAFGKVFSGMDVVRKIQAQKSNADAFEKLIGINKIIRL